VSIGTRAPKLLQQEATSTKAYFNKRLPQQRPTSTSTKRYFNILSTGADDRTLPQLKSQGTMLNYGYIKNEFDVHMRDRRQVSRKITRPQSYQFCRRNFTVGDIVVDVFGGQVLARPIYPHSLDRSIFR
jgi:hypothetical protein